MELKYQVNWTTLRYKSGCTSWDEEKWFFSQEARWNIPTKPFPQCITEPVHLPYQKLLGNKIWLLRPSGTMWPIYSITHFPPYLGWKILRCYNISQDFLLYCQSISQLLDLLSFATLLFKFKTSTCEIVEKMLVLAVGKEGKGEGRRTSGTETVKGGCVKEVCPIADLLIFFCCFTLKLFRSF